MKAVQYREIGKGPEVVDIDTPEPGPGQIRLRVTAAGLCHSDWFVMDLPEDQYTYGLPLTLGHEGVGVVDMLGDGVEGIEVGGPTRSTDRGGAASATRAPRVRRTTARTRPRWASLLPASALPAPWPNTSSSTTSGT